MAGWHFLRLKKGFDYNPEQNNRSVETKVVQDCCQELRDKRECCSLVSVCLAVVVPSEGAHTHCPAIGDLSREHGTPRHAVGALAGARAPGFRAGSAEMPSRLVLDSSWLPGTLSVQKGEEQCRLILKILNKLNLKIPSNTCQHATFFFL